MKFSYLLGLFLLIATPALAQQPALRPLPTGFHSGSYHLLNGDWQRAKIGYDTQSLRVSDKDHKPEAPLLYSAESVRAFVIGRDTFSVAREVDIPRPAQHFAALFVRQLYRRGGFQVSEYVALPPAPEPPQVYTVLVAPGQPATVLPPGKVGFRLALAKAVRDFEVLAHQLELDPTIMPVQLPEILTAYGNWKANQGK
ncbi:MAG: hypothetical protein WKG07_12730 [Hymenobacter sp.]